MTSMPKKKLTLSIDPKAIVRLEALAKKHNRSKSNMMEVLILQEYDKK